ncbi:hypothetical protein GCM10023196_003570 [Actinoallomurus vinaceus]|uniref:Uncharacterized protein n=1 Tax=Actinoallomurus vinaceus TaxID=1080074 RepID=A0ABP8TZG0_9ACTN
MNRRRTRNARTSHADAAWLASELREQADRHEPELIRIEDRFKHLTAEGSHSVGPARPSRLARLRPIGIPLGIAAAATAVSIAAAVTLGIGGGHDSRLSSQAGKPSNSRGAVPEHHQQVPQPTLTLRPTHTAGTTSTPGRPSAAPTARPLRAIGTIDRQSNQYWAQENLTVTTTRPIRGLHVSVKVSGGSTVQSTGSWSTINSADITTTVNRVPGGLVYDIALNPGQTLQAGTYSFGVQFNHPVNGHDFATDTYHVSATTADRSPSHVAASGAFAS